MVTLFATLSVIGAIAVNLIASELFEWGPRWAEMLVRRAATRWPQPLRDRMIEEWFGELNHRPGMFWKLWFAASLLVSQPPRTDATRSRPVSFLQRVVSHPALVPTLSLPPVVAKVLIVVGWLSDEYDGDVSVALIISGVNLIWLVQRWRKRRLERAALAVEELNESPRSWSRDGLE
jgi:hypothetical protein